MKYKTNARGSPTKKLSAKLRTLDKQGEGGGGWRGGVRTSLYDRGV